MLYKPLIYVKKKTLIRYSSINLKQSYGIKIVVDKIKRASDFVITWISIDRTNLVNFYIF